MTVSLDVGMNWRLNELSAIVGGVYDIPLHRQPVATKLGWQGHFPNAEKFCNRHICLPLYYGMTDEEAEYVADMVELALNKASQ
ncbi:DegT/DnrJ/EryC1/StrS family aminotransferase [Candidatus Entotheonella palauensis]|uniref:DegT/DnrJ/EryC1/StrS family aminotransferase n=1 Tax=Candidatus Entotheonella palauensis TaxID=93172 RepID=UPI0015C4CFD0|nr:DegT/DnrJ/EryC1/StrS family aminotransferase [Candidatus Entotheonella palauensis]